MLANNAFATWGQYAPGAGSWIRWRRKKVYQFQQSQPSGYTKLELPVLLTIVNK